MAFTEKKFNVDKFNELIGKFDEESNVEKVILNIDQIRALKSY